jgi:hypothetical protein
VAAPWRYSTLGHSISDDAAAPVVDDDDEGELSFPESPEKKDFTRLVNDPSEGAWAVATAGSGAALPPVKLPSEEHPATLAATVATPARGATARVQPRSSGRMGLRGRVGRELEVCGLRLVASIMLKPCQSSGRLQTPPAPANGGIGGKRLSTGRVSRQIICPDAADRP